MRLLSYNIHGCVGRGGRADPAAILRVIRAADADVVALQEVHDEGATDRSFLRALETQLDYPVVLYGPTMRKSEADYGNVLMSRWRPRTIQRLDLSQPGREPRGAIRILLEHASHHWEITATHLGLSSSERRQQIERLAQPSPSSGASIRILMGDLNEWFPGSRNHRLLNAQFGDAAPLPTFPAPWPFLELDRIHVHPRETHVTRQSFVAAGARDASDHLPLLADIFP